MIRIHCCENEHTAMIHTGGPADIRYKSFDVDIPELEAWIFELESDSSRAYNHRTVQGVEFLRGPTGGPKP